MVSALCFWRLLWSKMCASLLKKSNFPMKGAEQRSENFIMDRAPSKSQKKAWKKEILWYLHFADYRLIWFRFYNIFISNSWQRRHFLGKGYDSRQPDKIVGWLLSPYDYWKYFLIKSIPNICQQYVFLYFCARVSPMRPAPAEPPQGRKAARVCGCSGAT